MKVREVIKRIEDNGWRFHSQKGSHRQYTHPIKSGRVTVAGKSNEDMHPKTLAAIFQQAQMEKPKG